MTAEPSSSARPSLMPSMVLDGRYRLEQLLAQGGMGSVWQATNLVLDSRVAVKVLHRRQTQNATAEARLLREARAAAQIGHPNIVQVFDIGRTPTGSPFIVMELLQGEDLAHRLQKLGRITALEAVRIMLPVAGALAAAHAKGIVHRDLKPHNIVLSSDGVGGHVPKIVDFGIAKVDEGPTSGKLTTEGRVVGSPEYLSPEQARGQDDIDARTDVWSFSVTLYECLVGVPPFRDGNYNRLLRHIVEDDPLPTTDFAAGDKALWEILARGLARNREDRWSSMLEVGEALLGWIAQQGGETEAATLRAHLSTQPPPAPSEIRDCPTPFDGPPSLRPAPLSSDPGPKPDSTTRGVFTSTSPDQHTLRKRRAWIALATATLLAAGILYFAARHSPPPQAENAPAAVQPPGNPLAETLSAVHPAEPKASAAGAVPEQPMPAASTAASAVPIKSPTVQRPRRPAGSPPLPREPNY